LAHVDGTDELLLRNVGKYRSKLRNVLEERGESSTVDIEAIVTSVLSECTVT
jgi:hypothetical protein